MPYGKDIKQDLAIAYNEVKSGKKSEKTEANKLKTFWGQETAKSFLKNARKEGDASK